MIQIYLTLIEDEHDKARFEKAYYKYRKLLHYRANIILKDPHRAEDAAQEAFIRIAKNFHKIENVEDARTKNYFVMITERIALNMLKREEKFSTASEEELYFFDDLAASDSADDALHGTVLMEAILGLPNSYRDILYLQGIFGYNMKEIANLLEISEDAARKRFYRARTALEKKINE